MEGIYRLGVIVVLGLTLAGCDDVASQAENETESSDLGNVPPNQEAVAALVQKTMDNLVFVEGGSFQMGDFGPIDPKAGGLPYTAETDNKPLHKVTLDSYSISAYQVSYADFDIYTEATGQPRINTEGFEAEYRAPDVPAGVDWYQAPGLLPVAGRSDGASLCPAHRSPVGVCGTFTWRVSALWDV